MQKTVAIHARYPYLASHAFRVSDDGVRDIVLLATPCHLSARLDRHWFRPHQSSYQYIDR